VSIVSRGFRGRRREDGDNDRVTPGQYVVDDFPVLSAGPTPHTPLDQWNFAVEGEVEEPKHWSTCAACGAVGEVGQLLAYVHGPGTVIRCPRCNAVLMRIVHGADRYWIEIRGVRCLELAHEGSAQAIRADRQT
jgi:hypothetical protein